MSYDIELVDPVTREVLHVDNRHHMRGGTYAQGGTTELTLNVTYNYRPILVQVLPGESPESGKDFTGLRSLYGLTGAESIPLLKKAISGLQDDVDADYWKPTEGNVKQALSHLLAMAQLRPDGVWRGD